MFLKEWKDKDDTEREISHHAIHTTFCIS